MHISGIAFIGRPIDCGAIPKHVGSFPINRGSRAHRICGARTALIALALMCAASITFLSMAVAHPALASADTLESSPQTSDITATVSQDAVAATDVSPDSASATASTAASATGSTASSTASASQSTTTSAAAGSTTVPVTGSGFIGDSVVSPFSADKLLDIDSEKVIADAEAELTGGAQQTSDGALLPESVSASNFSTLIRFALQYRNWPYLWGSASPEPDKNGNIGFDCSGLVIYCYNNALNAGVDRTSAELLFYNHCTQISADEARPGDLVFYEGTYSLGDHDYYLTHISHVAIYCGDGIVYCAGDPIGFYPLNGATNIDGDPAVYFYARLNTIDNGSTTPADDIDSAYFPAYDYKAYQELNPDNYHVANASRANAFSHFFDTGMEAGEVASYVFDVNVYKACNPDLVAKYGNDLMAYYRDFLDTGMALGRTSSVWFDVDYYRANNPDLVAKYGDDLAAYYKDFESTGRAAGRAGVDLYDVSPAIVTMKHAVRNATGSALAPDITATLRGSAMTNGSDYQILYTDASGTVSSSAPSAAGSYTVTFAGAGSYHGSKVLGTFTIYDARSTIASGTRYRVRSVANSSYVLDVAGSTPVTGSNVSVWVDNGGANQAYVFEADGNGYYVLQNCGNSSLVLDAAGACPFSGCNVSTWTYNGGDNQRWVIIPTNGSTSAGGVAMSGTYKIASAYDSNIVLDVAGGVAVNDANVDVWSDNGGNNQKWTLAVDGQGYTDISASTVVASGMTRNATGVALSPTLSVTVGNTALLDGIGYQKTYTGIEGTNYPTSTVAPSAGGTYEVGIIGAGIYSGGRDVGTFRIYDVSGSVTAQTPYRVFSSINKSFVLDVASNVPQVGANVSVWTDNGGYNQEFTFEPGTDGYYTIHSCANTSFVLDAAGAVPLLGSNVAVWSSNGGMNQKWVVIPVGDGTFKIASAYDTSFVLDAAGSDPVLGANVSVWTDNGGGNQHWTISEQNDLSLSTVSSSGMSRNYNAAVAASGAGFKPTLSVSLLGKNLVEGVDYRMIFNGQTTVPSAPGDYTVVLYGLGSCFGTKTVGVMHIIDARSYVKVGTAYNIRSLADTKLVLDTEGAKPWVGSNVTAWTANGGYNQGYVFELGTDGYYMLHSSADNALVLDAAGAIPLLGSNVSVWSNNGGLNQKWVVIPQSDGSIKIASAYDTTFVLDASGAIPLAGSNVSVWTDNGGSNQKWVVTAAVFQTLSTAA